MTQTLFADRALLPSGWARDVLLRWNAVGLLTEVQAGAPAPQGVARAGGPVVPAMPNLHSHAFQRGFAGLTEFRGASAQDSFWSWRELMYRFAGRLTPDTLEQIATHLYVEMLEAGYTQVCEFQYVHHQADGTPYADAAAMSQAVLRAAHHAGIGITLLPVLYQSSGFGGQPPHAGQRRFLHSTDEMLSLWERLSHYLSAVTADSSAKAAGLTRLGLAPHSLRAVSPQALAEAVAGVRALDPTAPIHIHIAEQLKEVEDCLAWSGQRPVQWLLDHAPVDARWCLVHATHLDDAECFAAAASGAVAGLCPSTEANLGDGVFELPRWRAASGGAHDPHARHGVPSLPPEGAAPALGRPGVGAWGLGSDSHACVDPAEELLLLEYGQRLTLRQRNVGATADQPDVASALWLQAVAGGAQACGAPVAGLAVGQRADFVVLDAGHPILAGLRAEQTLAAHVFASSRQRAIDQVWVAGQPRVRGGHHPERVAAQRAFAQARAALQEIT